MAHYWLVQPKTAKTVSYRGRQFVRGRNARFNTDEAMSKYEGSGDLSYDKVEIKKAQLKPKAKDKDKAKAGGGGKDK